jgi:CRISPR-associated protein Csb2
MMFAIAVTLLSGRYTAMQFNDRTQPEWPPHPARLFSAMTAVWADAQEPDPAERAALQWLEEQRPPAISCSAVSRRAVVTHFVPVNDATALTRNVSRTFQSLSEARQGVLVAESSGEARALQRAREAQTKAEAKAISDVRKADQPHPHESASVASGVLEVLPENRGKQGRTYPTVIPDDPIFWFIWQDAEPSADHRSCLDRIVARIGRIGHSSTLVACQVADTAPAPTWVPGENGAVEQRLRVPRRGLIDRLETGFAAHQASEPRLLPAAMVGYRRPSAPIRHLAVPLLGGDWFVLGFQSRRTLPATRVLDVAQAARGALLSHGDQPLPEILSGHQRSEGGSERRTAPLERPHLAVVPLLNAGHVYSDGSVFGIALVLPADCPEQERSAVARAMQRWAEAEFELLLPCRSGPAQRYLLADLGVDRAAGSGPAWLESDLSARRKTTTRRYWCRPARRWLTVTPIALDQFPGNLRSRDSRTRDRALAEAEESVARACSFAGLPANPTVTIRLDAPLTGLPAASHGGGSGGGGRSWQYPGYRTAGGRPRVCVHAEIEFDQQVNGPVLVGAGRYFGYGLCLPSDAKEDRL